MLTVTSVIVEKCVSICFLTFYILQAGPAKCCGAHGNSPLLNLLKCQRVKKLTLTALIYMQKFAERLTYAVHTVIMCIVLRFILKANMLLFTMNTVSGIT